MLNVTLIISWCLFQKTIDHLKMQNVLKVEIVKQYVLSTLQNVLEPCHAATQFFL